MKDAAQQTEDQADNLPWFRYGMVWMMILLPLTAVVASLITLAIAHKHAPTLLPKAAAQLPKAAAQLPKAAAPLSKAAAPFPKTADQVSEMVVERVEQP